MKLFDHRTQESREFGCILNAIDYISNHCVDEPDQIDVSLDDGTKLEITLASYRWLDVMGKKICKQCNTTFTGCNPANNSSEPTPDSP